MKQIIVIGILLVSIHSFAQSPTYQALLKLNHSVDNNMFDLEIKPVQEDFEGKKSIIWKNVYFKYFKNPNTRGLQRSDESMKFSIRNQFLYRIYFSSDTIFTINLAKGSKDKLINVDVFLFTLEGNKVQRTKLKGRNYELTKGDEKIKLDLAAGQVQPGSFLNVLIEIESFNFKKLGPFDFSRPIAGNYELALSTNIPDGFNYLPPEVVELIDEKTGTIDLKVFTGSVVPIVDYKAQSNSYKWKITPDKTNQQILFTLESIKLANDYGTSVEQLMKTSQ